MTYVNEIFADQGAGSTRPEGKSPVSGNKKHRVLVTLVDVNAAAVSQRKEKIQKTARVSASTDQDAISKAKAHYKKQGYKVLDAECLGVVDESKDPSDDPDFYDPESSQQKQRDSGRLKPGQRGSYGPSKAGVSKVNDPEYKKKFNAALSMIDSTYNKKKVSEASVSTKQARTMAAAAHDKEFANRVGIKQSVAKEFNKADKGTKMLKKAMKESKQPKKLNESTYKVADPTLQHILDRFKYEVKQVLSGSEMSDHLYDALYDYYANSGEMPYGVMKARDGDPYSWISDRLDSDVNGVQHPTLESHYSPDEYGGEHDPDADDPMYQRTKPHNPDWPYGNDSQPDDVLSEIDEDTLSEASLDSANVPPEKLAELKALFQEIRNNTRAKTPPGYPKNYRWTITAKANAFVLKRQDEKVAENSKEGQYIRSLLDSAGIQYRWKFNFVGGMRANYNNTLIQIPYAQFNDEVLSEIDEYEDTPLYSGCYVRDNQDSSGEVFRMRGDPYDRRVQIEDKDGRGWNISPDRLTLVDENDPAVAQYFGGNDDDEEFTEAAFQDDAMTPEVEPGEELLVEGLEGVVTEILEEVGLDNGLDFFFEGGLVVIGRDTARVVIQALKNSDRILKTPRIESIDGEEVRIAFGEAAPTTEIGDDEIADLMAEPEFSDDETMVREGRMSEDVSMTITANGEEDFLSVLQRLSGMPVVATPSAPISTVTPPCGAATEIITTEEDEPEYANSPEEEVHTSTTDMINQGNDLHRQKRQYADRPYRGDNPMTEATKLMREYDKMLRSVTRVSKK